MSEYPALDRTPGSPVTYWTGRLLLLTAALLVANPLNYRPFDWLSLVLFLIPMGFLTLCLLKADRAIPAVAYLPLTALFCSLSFLMVNFVDLVFRSSWLYRLGDLLGALFSVALLPIMLGTVLAIVGAAKAKVTWLAGLGGGLILTAILSPSVYSLEGIGTWPALLLLLGIGVAWGFLLQFIVTAVPHRRGLALTMSALFTLVLATLFLLGDTTVLTPLALLMTVPAPENLLGGIWTWGAALLALYAVFLYVMDKGPTEDFFASVILATGVLLFKLLLILNSPLGWLLLPILFAGSLRCMERQKNGMTVLRLRAVPYLLIQLAAAALAAFLLYRDLWLNLLFAAVFGAILFRLYPRLKEEDRDHKRARVFWLLALIAIAAQAAAWLWRYRRAPAPFIAVALALGVSIAVLFMIFRPGNRFGRVLHLTFALGLCAALTALCICSMVRFGAGIDVTAPSPGVTAVEIVPRGEDNALDSATCTWQDFLLQPIQTEELSAGVNTLPTRGERLVITATDAHGVTTTVTYRVPMASPTLGP